MSAALAVHQNGALARAKAGSAVAVGARRHDCPRRSATMAARTASNGLASTATRMPTFVEAILIFDISAVDRTIHGWRYSLRTGTRVMEGSTLRYPPLSMIHGCSR